MAEENTMRNRLIPLAMLRFFPAALAALAVVWLLSPTCATARPLTEERLKAFEAYTVGDDQARDLVRPVDRPRFISVPNASLVLERDEVVFVEEAPDGVVRIYPRLVLLRHEVVNIAGDEQFRCVTYCPFTGSLIGYIGRIEGDATSLGTTNQLLNSNRILYDRSTGARWPQILGQAIDGPVQGEFLQRFGLLWTTWERAREVYPDAQVLSRPRSGPNVNYSRDPYGSYRRSGTYYDTGGSYYPLLHTDTRVHPKTRVIGLADHGGSALAINKDTVKQVKAVTLGFGLNPVAAFYDPQLDTVRTFAATVNDRPLHFELVDGVIRDTETHTQWNHHGVAVQGRLRETRLAPMPGMDCMWFAWKAFHNHTQYWDGETLYPY
jgi:hypothetical protein